MVKEFAVGFGFFLAYVVLTRVVVKPIASKIVPGQTLI